MSIRILFIPVLLINFTSLLTAQIHFDSTTVIKFDSTAMTVDHEKNLKVLQELTGIQRLDVEGFIIFEDEYYSEGEDPIPQNTFVIKYPLSDFNEKKTLEQNFLRAISKSNVSAYEEIFNAMRWTMPSLFEELKKCETLIMKGSLGPYTERKLNVIYGRIVYTVKQRPEIYPPQISFIELENSKKKYTIKVLEQSTNGYPYYFKALK